MRENAGGNCPICKWGLPSVVCIKSEHRCRETIKALCGFNLWKEMLLSQSCLRDCYCLAEPSCRFFSTCCCERLGYWYWRQYAGMNYKLCDHRSSCVLDLRRPV